ncbi:MULTISPECIES: hypothetical protein [spotted fever group]|uniref:Uncharacterized protein n=2 Tax=spotted fever group TaxID=114277 RepID=A0AAD1CBG7_RICJA|nr:MULTISPECIES: hypothetical protein [spotted fever group]AEK74820.1 hypothetical protein Rh054_04485 [Rickettsia conorii subsp. heilongjiangensis 054]KJW04155.1 hypothetical protein RAT170B_1293 [Rickettsia argasii T170-B]UZW38202.1 hypothetical protein OSR38_04265 [Rickettsia conorii subsp. heilongjiangensis]BAW82941.1 predicted protein [Rickettsia japonica]
MSRTTIVREMRKTAELFKNFDITKSLNFYGNLATKYEAVVNEFFNSNSFNTEKPEKGIQPNAMKNFLNLIGSSILKVLSAYSETDEIDLLEVIQSSIRE